MMSLSFSVQAESSLFLRTFQILNKKETRIAAFGKTTLKMAEKHGLKVQIKAPTPEAPSMTMALENYIKDDKK